VGGVLWSFLRLVSRITCHSLLLLRWVSSSSSLVDVIRYWRCLVEMNGRVLGVCIVMLRCTVAVAWGVGSCRPVWGKVTGGKFHDYTWLLVVVHRCCDLVVLCMWGFLVRVHTRLMALLCDYSSVLQLCGVRACEISIAWTRVWVVQLALYSRDSSLIGNGL
jgi:hypothetical protein